MEIDYKAIGVQIRTVRNKRGLTQEQLVESTGLSNTHISNIETGHTKLSLPAIIKIANALSVSVDELLRDSVEKSEEVFRSDLSNLLEDCNDKELRVILPAAAAIKSALRKVTNRLD